MDGNALKKYKSLNYTNFNSDMDSFVNSNNLESSTDYLLVTNLKTKYTYVYNKSNNKWIRMYKWISTVGKPSTPTRKGIFFINGRKAGFSGADYSVKYATRIVDGYYYHSILYDKTGKNIKDGRLGGALSHGCIRLNPDNAKWIYDNIPDNTTVLIA